MVTLLKKTALGIGCGVSTIGGEMGRGFCSTTLGKGVAVAVEGGSPNSAAEVGKGADREGGLVGGLEE